MTKYLSLLVLLFLPYINYVQSEFCGTANMDSTEFVNLPYFGNNQYLIDLLDSAGIDPSSSNRNFEEDILFRIPIKIWNYRDGGGNGGISMEDLQLRIQELNTHNITNCTGFRYYLLCNISNIDNGDHLNVTELEAFNLSNSTFGLYQDGAVNIHLVESLNSGAGGVYISPSNSIFIDNDRNGRTWAHEIGHFFGLEHTHRKWDASIAASCKSEPVDRSSTYSTFSICPGSGTFSNNNLKCESTGDAFRSFTITQLI